jgi:hypothetical protein
VPVTPSSNEQEYFARLEAEKRRKHAEEARKHFDAAEREKQKQLHYMHCPKCGMELEEIAFGEVHVDKCFNCEGLWLDQGELERLRQKETGFFGKLLDVFRA